MTTASIIIKSGREKPILNQHPWIFSGAIDSVQGDPTPGDIVTVKSHEGRFLARGYWNPKSQIQVRILTWQDEEINEAWWRRMLKRAIDARKHLRIYSAPYNIGCRLVNAENDYLPGLIIDCYGDWLVVQALTYGIDQRKLMLSELTRDILSADSVAVKGVFERSDVDVRAKEGLQETTGTLWGEDPPEYIEISDVGAATIPVRYLIDIRKGHKTGFYLDQRSNRLVLNTLLFEMAPENDSFILNLFSYTGSFGLLANLANHYLGSRFHVVNIDSSYDMLKLAEGTYQLNNFPSENVEFIQADVFQLLRDYADEKKQFDVVILDPPKFAFNAGQIEKAARGYKDINLNAFKCVKPGGYLMTFSCSGAITADLFQKIVFGALADSGRQAQILKHLGPGDDHPVALTFPEGAYLKGLLLRVY